MPALGLALGVLEREGEDALGSLDGLLALLGIGLESLVDGIKGRRGRESVWTDPHELVKLSFEAGRDQETVNEPFLRDMIGIC